MSAQIVSFRCTLKDRFGHVISTSVNRDVSTTLQGDDGAEVPLVGLVKRMQNLSKGERREIHLRAEDAYGFYDPKHIVSLSREDWPLRVKPVIGMEVPLEDGKTYRVTEMRGESVVLDGNHPLAGQDLIFEIEAMDVKPETDSGAEIGSASESVETLLEQTSYLH